MTQSLTIRFELASFNPEVFGMTRAQVEADPDLFAEAVSGIIAIDRFGNESAITPLTK